MKVLDYYEKLNNKAEQLKQQLSLAESEADDAATQYAYYKSFQLADEIEANDGNIRPPNAPATEENTTLEEETLAWVPPLFSESSGDKLRST